MGMDVKVETGGLDSLVGRLAGADKVVKTAAFHVQTNAQKEIQTGTKSGRIYSRGTAAKGARGKGGRFLKVGSKVTHQASAPGEAPAIDTGHLVNSIATRKSGELEYEVAVGAEYGALLEEDRPFLKPAMDKVAPSFIAAVKKLVSG